MTETMLLIVDSTAWAMLAVASLCTIALPVVLILTDGRPKGRARRFLLLLVLIWGMGLMMLLVRCASMEHRASTQPVEVLRHG